MTFGIISNFESGTCASMQKYWFQNLTSFLPDPDVTSIKSKLCWHHRVEWPSLSIHMCKMIQKTCFAWHVCDFYFLVNFWNLTMTLTLTFPGMTFVLKQYSSQTFTSTFCEFEPFVCCPSNWHYGPKCDCVFIYLTLTLHKTFILKC